MRARLVSSAAVSNDEAERRAAPPLLLLTGFLGAGKTTTLNRVLGRQHRLRIGVIVNELGRIDIDGRLIRSRAGDVMELVGGCVCHEVRIGAISAAHQERPRGRRRAHRARQHQEQKEGLGVLHGRPLTMAQTACAMDAPLK